MQSSYSIGACIMEFLLFCKTQLEQLVLALLAVYLLNCSLGCDDDIVRVLSKMGF
jgi:hypothetical protein